jgi:hemerythrin-like domain-containing protein
MLMSSQVAVWKAEHRAFGALLALLEQQLQRVRKGEAPNFQMMLDIVDYMIDYADRFHHPKEDLVFARIAELHPEMAGSVRELGHEHAAIVASGRALAREIEAVVGGAIVERGVVEELGQRYLDACRRHMYAEEQGLFPAAVEYLSDEDWKSIERASARGNDPLFGERPEQRYHALRSEIRSLIEGPGCERET